MQVQKIFSLLLFFTVVNYSHAQFTHKIKADSVRIYNDNCNAELIVENSTKDIAGFLFNRGNGRTEFRKVLQKLNDTSFLVGVDTLIIRNPLDTSILLGGYARRNGSNVTGTWGISVTGNAGTVTNGVYSSGTYVNPSWISSLDGSKITGSISGFANSETLATVTGRGSVTSYTVSLNGGLISTNGSFSGNISTQSNVILSADAATVSTTFAGITTSSFYTNSEGGNISVDGFNNFNFRTGGVNGSRNMVITGAGKVGIGTTSPNTALEVNGGIISKGTAPAYTINALITDYYSGYSRIIGTGNDNSTNGAIDLITASANASVYNVRIRVTPSGRVLFGSITDDGSSIAQFNGQVFATGRFYAQGTGYNNNTSAEVFLKNTTSSTGREWVLNSANTGIFQIADNTAGGATRVSIDHSGAATFSSSVTASSFNGSGAGLTGNANNLSSGYLVNRYIATNANDIWQAGVYTFYDGINVPGGDFGMISIPTWSATSATSKYNLQIGSNIGGNLRYRATNIHGEGDWLTLLSSNNYNSYSPSLTGAGASGTWSINITGAASSWGVGSQVYNQGNITGGTPNFMTFNGTGWGYTTTAQVQSVLGLGSAAYVSSNQNLTTSSNVQFAQLDASLIRSSGDIIAFSTSDRRLKSKIMPIADALTMVKKIGGYSYEWNEQQAIYKGKDYGILAQEVEAIMPEIVQTRDNGYKAVKYDGLIPLLLQAIKELQAKVEKLESNVK
jgi:hypothetical protein